MALGDSISTADEEEPQRRSSEVVIIHLSDLHIKSSDGQHYQSSLDYLIKDLANQLDDVCEALLAITGDIVDQGNYSSGTQRAVLKFFINLKEKIGDKVKYVQIVPGNHDKKRNEINGLLSSAVILPAVKADEANKIVWAEQKKALSGFMALSNKIINIFEPGSKYPETFGVSVVECAGTRLCFVRLDTAWCSYTESDERKLIIGDYQRKSLTDAYDGEKAKSNETDKPFALTIAVSHFPLNWLNPAEEHEINKLFLSGNGLDVDILLCGHIHNFELLHHFNHKHSLLTLMTGIGGKENQEDQRYSIYVLNVNNNSCNIIMRKSVNSNIFDYDYSIYNNAKTEGNKLTYPIKIRQVQPFIHVPHSHPIYAKSVIVDEGLIKMFVELSESLNSMARNITNISAKYKELCLDSCKKSINLDTALTDDKKNMTASEIYNYLYPDTPKFPELSEAAEEYFKSSVSWNITSSFLTEICTSLHTYLEPVFKKGTEVRTHVRLYNNDDESDSYIALECYPPVYKKPRNIPWGGMIEYAFKEKKAVVHSASFGINASSTQWPDFITIVPDCIGNTTRIKVKHGAKFTKEDRPLLTYGLSIKPLGCSEYNSRVLYVLSCLKPDIIIKEVLDDYFELFKVNLMEYLHKTLEINTQDE